MSVWRDKWLGPLSLQRQLQLPSEAMQGLKAKVSDLIVNSEWFIPHQVQNTLMEAGMHEFQLPPLNLQGNDYRIWTPGLKGQFSVLFAFNDIRKSGPKLQLLREKESSWHLDALFVSVIVRTSSTSYGTASLQEIYGDGLPINSSSATSFQSKSTIKSSMTDFTAMVRRLPPQGYMKLKCDGAPKGNPGPAGVNTNFLAEVLAIMEALEIALSKGWSHLLVESDSTAAIKAFGTGNLP
ncbi:hypothetical protein IFM89_004593 [Coptis chinensis]|uniref:RNase H type-1 domain-containing protein n=1 Tax=Coptis chinensis TaxID=261450 RepID=A0A835H204_9MAGN|nr:hypothetical protein IFM89_004593 [Coptis chinensis]